MIFKLDFDKYERILEPADVEVVKKENNKYYEYTPSSILFRGDSLFTNKFLEEIIIGRLFNVFEITSS